MVQRKTVAGFETFTISSKDGSTQATFVPERGGVASSIIMSGSRGGRELLFCYPHLWERNSNQLPGGWPFCFPVCGRLEQNGHLNQYSYNGHIYELPIHGFAWRKVWKVAEAGEDFLRMVLRDDEETRAVYPFHFTVELVYEIRHKQLFCRQNYSNHGDRPMPYYAGFHPYFLTPAPGNGKEKVILNFSPRKRMLYNPTLTAVVGEQPLLNLPVSVADPQIHEQLWVLGEDKEIHLTFPDLDVINMGVEGVEDVDMFSYLQIYSPADQPFICVEPWMGYPNALNNTTGVRWLAPGQTEHALLRLWIEVKVALI